MTYNKQSVKKKARDSCMKVLLLCHILALSYDALNVIYRYTAAEGQIKEEASIFT